MKRITQNLKWLVTLLTMIVSTGAWGQTTDVLNRAFTGVTGSFVYDNTTWQRLDDDPRDGLIHVRATNGGAEMWIDAKAELPFVVELRNNPFGIDWRLE